MLEREDSPWYPTMRLFRQDRSGDWRSAFAKAEAALGKILSGMDVEMPEQDQATPRTTRPFAPVSWGEIIDKITILEIKSDRLQDPAALQNVRFELAELNRIVDDNFAADHEILQIKQRLREVNEALWEIEDQIRDKEQQKDFGTEFVELARSVYITNDKRSSVKRAINELTLSDVCEEKHYAKYE
jgi:chaperonin cofactor prefoldin